MKLLNMLVVAALSCGAVAAQAEGPIQKAMEKRRAPADANKDGNLTDNEIEKAWADGKANRKAAFKDFDKNGDGVLVRSEYDNATAFKKTDVNGDGKITENEFLGTIAKATVKELDKTDSNDDGVLSADERAKRIQERVERRRAAK